MLLCYDVQTNINDKCCVSYSFVPLLTLGWDKLLIFGIYVVGKIWWSCSLNLSKIKETAFWLSVSKSIHLISVSIGGLYRHLHFTFHVHKEQYLPRKKTEEDTYFSQFTIERSSESFENSLLSTIVCNCMLNNLFFLRSHAKLRIVFDRANSLTATKVNV